jgi:hypothetical protein
MNTLTSNVKALAGTVVRKDFSTGSKGFFTTGKVAGDNGLYQAQVTAILVGSKNEPGATIHADNESARETLMQFVETNLSGKTFSSGKTGAYGSGKVAISGQVYQVAAQAVFVR